MYKEVKTNEAMGFFPTKPVMIVTTLHESGIVNAGVFGAYTNLSGTQVGIAIGSGSHTFANILRTGEFVINIPGADLVKSLGIIAKRIPESKSEVDEAGLSIKPGVTLETPSIAECQSAIEFKFEQEVPTGYHHFMIGRVTGGWVREAVMSELGGLDIFKAKVLKDYAYPEPLYMLPGEVIEG